MTKSAKRFLALSGVMVTVPLVIILLPRHSPTEAATSQPSREEQWRDLFASAGANVPRLRRSPTRPAVGLCGTEIQPPESGLGSVPPALHDLTAHTPSAEAVAAAAKEWLVDEGGVLDVVDLTAQGTAMREALEVTVAASLDEEADGVSDWLNRIQSLDDLGRPNEALSAARHAHDRWPGFDTTSAVFAALLYADRPAEARELVDRELAGEAYGEEQRSWLTFYRGVACSDAGDHRCVGATTTVLGTSSAAAWMPSWLMGYDLISRGRLAEAETVYSQSSEQGLGDEAADYPTSYNRAMVATCVRRKDAKERWAEVAKLAESSSDVSGALEGAGYTYLTEGDAARAWVYTAGALAAGGDGAFAKEPRKTLALTSLSLGDLAEARRQIQHVAGPDFPRDPVAGSCYTHLAETASLRALYAEARGDALAAQRYWIEVARSGHPVLGTVARHALAGLCPRVG